MRPEFAPTQQVVANHELIFAALLLRDRATAFNREARPSRADIVTPEFPRRSWFPIARKRRTGQNAVAIWSEELRITVGELCCARTLSVRSALNRNHARLFPSPLDDGN